MVTEFKRKLGVEGALHIRGLRIQDKKTRYKKQKIIIKHFHSYSSGQNDINMNQLPTTNIITVL